MSYEDAPATKMLATHCAACGRPLLDAPSVERGIGPECARRHSLPATMDEDTRAAANKLIHECAREDVHPDALAGAIVALSLLGCVKIAERVSKRAGRTAIEITDDGLALTNPYSQAFLAARGAGRWDAAAKVTRYPLAAGASLAATIVSLYGANRAVRVERGGDVTFVRAADLAACLPVPPPPASDDAPYLAETETARRWVGSPAKTLRGEWGVQLTEPTGIHARAGDLVLVRTRAGKEWTARLARSESMRVSGPVWLTKRV